MLADQRMLKRNVDRAIAIFNVKNNRIAAGVAPSFYNLNTVIAAGHESGQVDCPYFEVLSYRNGFFCNGIVKNAGNSKLLSRFQERTTNISIGTANRLCQLR